MMRSPKHFDEHLRIALVGGSVAAIVSCVTLVWATGQEPQRIDVATSPFGWNRVIVIHACSTIVFSWWLARGLTTFLSPPTRRQQVAIMWVVAGIGVSVLTFSFAPTVRTHLDEIEAGFATRFVIRVLWCAALQTPWCAAAILWSRVTGRAETRIKTAGDATAKREVTVEPHATPTPAFTGRNLLGLGILTAVGVPMSFFAVFVEQQTQLATVKWQQGKLIEARDLVQRLCDIGSTSSLGERTVVGGAPNQTVAITPRSGLADLNQAVRFVQRQIEELKPMKQRRQQLAQYYLSLGREAEAQSTLEQIADTDPNASLMLARVLRARGKTQETERWARHTIELLDRPEISATEEADASDRARLGAYDLLIVQAGEQSDFDLAERYLLEALETVPSRRAEVHARLAKHYQFIGELKKSFQQQQEAAELSPDAHAPPEPVWAKVLSTGAPVGLARPKSSRYK